MSVRELDKVDELLIVVELAKKAAKQLQDVKNFLICNRAWAAKAQDDGLFLKSLYCTYKLVS